MTTPPPNLREIPPVGVLMSLPPVARLSAAFSPSETLEALRAALHDLRADLRTGRQSALPDFAGTGFAAGLEARITQARQPSQRPVINATGVIIHTNLGRARLAPAACAALHAAATDATNLELDLTTGKRGSRHAHTEALICALTGAQAAVVVNNCAAAVLLALMATASGRSVIASRGELIEIGGSYRLPDVIVQSGAQLREVGTTNKTRTADYAAAIDDTTAVLMKTHTSNFRIIGFTGAPPRAELAALARHRKLILMEDLGSGVLVDLAPYGLPDEPVVADILKSGVDLVMFSGDKLLGGPQAGIIAGRADLVAALKAHPLMRALRIDKLSLAALEATLRLYRAPHDPMVEVPVLRMLSTPLEAVTQRAQRLLAMLAARAHLDARVVRSTGRVGAGALPEHDLPSAAVSLAVPGQSADATLAALRAAPTPIIARIHKDRVLLDMRTVEEGALAQVAQAVGALGP